MWVFVYFWMYHLSSWDRVDTNVAVYSWFKCIWYNLNCWRVWSYKSHVKSHARVLLFTIQFIRDDLVFVCVFVLIEERCLDVLFVIHHHFDQTWVCPSKSCSSVPERPDAPGLFPVNERWHLQTLDAEELTVVIATSCRANLPTHSILCVCVSCVTTTMAASSQTLFWMEMCFISRHSHASVNPVQEWKSEK